MLRSFVCSEIVSWRRAPSLDAFSAKVFSLRPDMGADMGLGLTGSEH